jgi:hypothetical protein
MRGLRRAVIGLILAALSALSGKAEAACENYLNLAQSIPPGNGSYERASILIAQYNACVAALGAVAGPQRLGGNGLLGAALGLGGLFGGLLQEEEQQAAPQIFPLPSAPAPTAFPDPGLGQVLQQENPPPEHVYQQIYQPPPMSPTTQTYAGVPSVPAVAGSGSIGQIVSPTPPTASSYAGQPSIAASPGPPNVVSYDAQGQRISGNTYSGTPSIRAK